VREQVITPRLSGRGGDGGGGRAPRSGEIVQRPARREKGGRAPARSQGGGKLRQALAYFPLIARITVAVALGALLFMGYRAAANASFFQARKLDVGGVSRANADEIRAVVRRNVAATGVWKADLSSISADLEKLPWVRAAVVSRVLPDGLRVRVTERVQSAVVRTSNGKFIWVDDDAVSLGAMSPADHMPPFFIHGWDETNTEDGHALNRERVRKYLELSRVWESAGLAGRVSEINLGDLRDVRVQLAGDDSQIEVRLGEKDFDNRLRRALKVLDEEKNKPGGPIITYLVALDRRIDVGTSSGTQLSGDNSNASHNGEAEANVNRTGPRETHPAARSINHGRDASEADARKEKGSRQKSETLKGDAGKKDQRAKEDKSQVRPRRVG
jgi:cell division septal protein FtsQ